MIQLMFEQASQKQGAFSFPATMSLNNGMRSCAKLLMSSEVFLSKSGQFDAAFFPSKASGIPPLSPLKFMALISYVMVKYMHNIIPEMAIFER